VSSRGCPGDGAPDYLQLWQVTLRVLDQRSELRHDKGVEALGSIQARAALPQSQDPGQYTVGADGRVNYRPPRIVSESYGHENLKQTNEYLELLLDDVQRKRTKYIAHAQERMRKGLSPKRDFSIEFQNE